MIKIAIITHDLALGGLQQVIVNICNTIDRALFDPQVLCLRTTGDYAPEIERLDIKVTLIPQKKKGADYFAFLKVARILKKEKIQVIHTHNTQPFIDGTIGGILAGVKTIIHTDHARAYPDKLRYMFAEWLLSHFVSKVVAVSGHTAQDLMKFERINPKKLMVIPNGIDGKKYSIKIDKTAKRSELGITNKGPVIGIGVRLCEQKGISYLLKAMPEIIKSFPDCTLAIAGRGPMENDFKREADDLHIQNNVKFLGMRLDIPELLQMFDCYILPSFWEGMPMVLLEAMAAGCPIVSTNVGGVPSVLKSEESGLLIEPRNSGAISGAIIRMLTDNELRSRVAKNAFELFNRDFDSRIMTKQYERLYALCDKIKATIGRER